MENFADNAQPVTGQACVADISGVKMDSSAVPDGDATVLPCDADGGKTTVTGCTECDGGDDFVKADDSLEAQFDALVNGKFKEVYQKRTQGIIRKRLRSVKVGQRTAVGDNSDVRLDESIKGKSPIAGAINEASMSASTAQEHSTSEELGDGELGVQSAIAAEQLRSQNKKRPIENGLGGSCGIVTKINVSALDGQGVLAILRRVGSGEKISFK